ncbi:hypothetical protein K227x_43230 [Rubripirellula lacrimiformis]|uniref:DUF1559 domain-containing protein n=1 Tax=Rubripirellula lacrimiformis TaxID=1930273 RepID=A0A517NFR0_9BACT|nr:DUF1559 domain-containing protein [Rubripirellula lacrimiformis]QDT05918.1 hypothetical protein K227x_43230 [Rubripirellula lacrimiformis]
MNRSKATKHSVVSKRLLPLTNRPRRRGLTVLELLVTMTIIAVVAALLLPAVNSARESARRIQCVDHLREVGLALHTHHDSKRHLPVGWAFDPTDDYAYGWAVSLLPYLGQDSLAQHVDRSAPPDNLTNLQARTTSIAGMLCPSDIAAPSFVMFAESEDDDKEHGDHAMTLGAGSGGDTAAGHADRVELPLIELPTANYVGVFGTLEPDDSIPAPIGDGAFLENRIVRFRDFQRGLSHTLMVGERTMAQVPSTWFGVKLAGEDAAARMVGSTLEGINNRLADECDFSSRHPGGANFLWGDGHVSFVSQQVDLREYHRWAKLRDH